MSFRKEIYTAKYNINLLWLLNVICFRLVLQISIVSLTYSAASTSKCGEYGFNCINKKAYQICDMDEGQEEPDDNRNVEGGMCPENTICDENYPFYCTPSTNKEREQISSKPLQTSNRFNYLLENKDRNLENKAQDYLLENKERNLEKKVQDYSHNEKTDLTIPIKSVTFDSAGPFINIQYPDSIAFQRVNYGGNETTITSGEATTSRKYYKTDILHGGDEGITEMYTTHSTYPCTAPGNYPDPRSPTKYFFCDIDKSGEGYVAMHLSCFKDRVFDSHARECVLPVVLNRAYYRPNRLGNRGAYSSEKYFSSVQRQTKSCYKNGDGSFKLKNIDFGKKQALLNMYRKKKSLGQARPEQLINKMIEELSEMQHKQTSPSVGGTEIMVPPATTSTFESIPFVCHTSGSHPDTYNSTLFYVCHPKRSIHSDGFDKITMICPREKIYDSHKKYCVDVSSAKSATKLHSHSPSVKRRHLSRKRLPLQLQ